MSNFGFTGQVGGGLSMESAVFLLLFYLWTYKSEAEDTPIMSMIVTMLEICEEKIL